MTDPMSKIIVLFVLIQVLVIALVLRRVLKLSFSVKTTFQGLGPGPTTLDQLKAVGDFAREQHQRIGEYMRANWSGFAEQLPSVITSLTDELERDAKAKGLTMNREFLKTMVASSLRAHKIGKGRELGEALKKVA